MNELVRILPPQVWTSSIEISPDSVQLTGEAAQAAPLLKLLDSSPFFEKSEFVTSVTRNGSVDQFRIKTMRRGRAGRSTP
jgi:Tfp pilus assembly protein PilN